MVIAISKPRSTIGLHTREDGTQLGMISRFTLLGLLLLAVPGLALPGPGSPDRQVEGTVKDTTGAVISGAEVVLQGTGFSLRRMTGGAGEFGFEHVPEESGTLVVRAAGFERLEQAWRSDPAAARLQIVLRPAAVTQQLTITATRTPMRIVDSPTSVVVFSPDDLSSAAALSLDGVLRQAPGFSLFRRTDSRTANPTAQGVSLRGLGASGASRALVISGDNPQNDPFGGWVYWDRIPHAAIDSVDIGVGGASPLYGSQALGGVINIIRRPIDQRSLTLYSSYGNERTPDASLFASETHGPWAGAVDAELFRTDGYIPVPLALRGKVDSFASSEYATGDLTLQRKLGDAGRVFLRGSSFGESRNNGTLLQNNRTTIREIDLGGDWRSDTLGQFSAVGYVGREVFNQTFSSISSVSANRDTETLTRVQRVPAQEVGISAQWSRALGRRQNLVAGVEAHEFRGESDELAMLKLPNGTYVATTAVDSGGRQHNVGVFGEDIIRLSSRWLLTPMARVDHWSNFEAFSSTQPLRPTPGAVVRTPLAERSETFFSPRLSTLYRLTSKLSLTGSAYRSFRAPTLNELYRSFRVGNIVTQANDQLVAERLTGGEGGGIVTGFNQRLMVRGNFFWAEITRPIENVTVGALPNPGCLLPGATPCTLITRKRENLGRTRSRGLEVEAEAHVNSALTLSGGLQYADAVVVSFPSATTIALQSLQGLQIPQVPRHAFTFQARYCKPRWILLGVQGRFVGVQFDDDLNAFLLRRYFTLDLMASHPLTSGLEVFVAAENLLNQRYDIGRTPVLSVGPPILVRTGLRLRLGAR